jgi:hypothetical protein
MAVLGFAIQARAADLDKFLLDDTDGIVRINVKQILASDQVQTEYGTKLKEALAGTKEVQTILIDLGLDPLKDIDSVVAVLGASRYQSENRIDKGGKPGGNPGGVPFFVCQGRFDPTKVDTTGEKLAKDMPQYLKIHDVGQHKVYQVTFPKFFDAGIYLALLDQNTLVAGGRKDQIAEAFDKSAGKKKTIVKSQAMARLLDDMDRKSPVAFAAVGTLIVGNTSWTKNENGVITIGTAHHTLSDQGIESANGSLKLADKITGSVTLTFKDVDTAQKMLAEMQKGLDETIKEGEKFIAQQKELTPLLEVMKSIRLKAKDNALSLEGEGPVNTIEAAIKGWFTVRAVEPVPAKATIQNK